MKNIWMLVAVPVVLCWAAFSTSVADVKTGNSVTILAEETIDDDLYIFANTITVDGTIKGDLVAAGREIVISGTVEGDIIAAAQKLVVNGHAADDVRIAGQSLELRGSGTVGDDLLAAGFSLFCASGSEIAGEAKFAGYQASFAGNVEEDLNCAVANCLLSGTVGQNVHLIADGSGQPLPPFLPSSADITVPAGLTVRESAIVQGDLNYQAVREASIDPAAQIKGTVKYQPIANNRRVDPKQPRTVSSIVGSFKYFAALFVVGAVLVTAFPGWTQRITANIQQEPLASLGWGIVTFFCVLLVAAMLFVGTITVAVLLGIVSLESLILSWLAIGTIGTAGLLAGFGILSVWISKVLVSFWAGSRIAKLKQQNLGTNLLALTLGLLIFVGISSIPWFGGIFGLLVSLCGTGAVAIWAFRRLSPRDKTITFPPVKTPD